MLLVSMTLFVLLNALPTQHVEAFQFLVEKNSFQVNEIYFLGAGLNERELFHLTHEIRKMGWLATQYKTHVLEATLGDVNTNWIYGKYMCRIMKIADRDDNSFYYRDVTSPFPVRMISNQMHTPLPNCSSRPHYECCQQKWLIHYIKLETRILCKDTC